MILTNSFFTGDFAPRYPSSLRHFFTTHFSICHSFLDFLYIAFSRHSGKLFVRPPKYPLPCLTCDTVTLSPPVFFAPLFISNYIVRKLK